MAQDSSYDRWARQREAKKRRNETIALLSAAAATVIVGLLMIGQLLLGRLERYDWSEPAAYALAGLLAVTVVAMLIAPKPVLTAISTGFRAVSEALFFMLGSVLTGVLYFLSLPLGATLGRRHLTQRHPAIAPWFDPRHRKDWRRSTWTTKDTRVDRQGGRRSTIASALRVFIEQRNYLLLVVLIALLLLATVTMFAKSSAVAPFVYTLF